MPSLYPKGEKIGQQKPEQNNCASLLLFLSSSIKYLDVSSNKIVTKDQIDQIKF